MKAFGFDSYNQTIEKELMVSIKCPVGGDSIPKVLVVEDENNDTESLGCTKQTHTHS